MDGNLVQLLEKHFFNYPRPLEESIRFKRDLKADSLDLLEILCDIEREYHLFVPEEELAQAATVADMDRILMEIRGSEQNSNETNTEE